MPWRFGRPKEMFEAPQVVLTPSSSRRRRTSVKTWWPAVAMAPIGMTSGSTTMSWAGMPKSAARWTIFLATAKRTSGSSEMPVSSLEMATTATLYFLISGRTFSSRSSSPVTELTSGRPLAVCRPASSAPGTDESMQSGVSTRVLHGVDQLRHQDRLDEVVVGVARVLPHQVGEDRAGIDVEHRRAGLGLGDGVGLDAREVVALQLLIEDLAAGRVDPLADDAEGLVEPDDDFLGRRGNDRAGHDGLPWDIKISLYRYL